MRYEPMKPRLLAVSALIALPWHAVAAQNISPELAEVAELLQVGQHIRIATVMPGQLEGVLVSRQESELELVVASRSMQISLQDVDRLWVRGRATETGALVGFGVGTVLGAAAGLFVGEVICDDPDCQANTAGAIATFGLLGAGVGVASGALIGRAIPSWRLRFP